MKKIYLFILSALLLTGVARAQLFSWVTTGGNSTFIDHGFGVAVDSDHNAVVTGMHLDAGMFGATAVPGFGYQDAFVAKYDSLGNLLWVRGIGGGEQDWSYAVSVDASDNIYITGTYAWYAIHFTATDSLAISAPQATNTFLAKYDANGNFQWARSGGCSYSKSSAVTTDPTGNVIVSGFFNGSINFSSTVLTGGATNLFFVKYSPAGTIIWAKAGTTSSMCFSNALKCDASGNIYATGKISQTITFASTPYTNNGGDDMYTAKFDSNGNVQWLRVEGKPTLASTTANNFDCGNGIDIDNSGNVYVAGCLFDTFVSSTFYQELAIVKYNNSGVKQWLHSYGSTPDIVFNSLSVDAAGNAIVGGCYQGALTIGPAVFPNALDLDILIAKFNPAGNCISAIALGTGNGDAAVNGIVVDKTVGLIYLAGTMRNNVNFGSIPVSGDNAGTVFTAKMPGSSLPSSISEQGAGVNYSLFPNPSNDVLHVQLENAGTYVLEIYNSTGQIVHSETLNGQSNVIDLGNFASGFYSVSVMDENGNRTVRKIVKE